MGDDVYEITNVQAAPHDRAATVCDSDEGKLEILKTEVLRHAKLADVFEIAVAIRENLPPGLEPDDFDGHNIESLLEV